MELRSRLLHWTTGVTVGTAALVGAAALSPWPVPAMIGAAAVALAGAHLARGRALDGTLASLDALTRALRKAGAADLARVPELHDREIAQVAHAVNALLDRLEAERGQLVTQATLARSLLERSPSGVLVVGADGRIRFVNPAFRRMVELRGEPSGHRPIEVIPVAEVQVAVDRALDGEETAEASCTSGRLDLNLQAVHTQGGEVMVLVQDVTRFRQAERARTDFVANVSHELRTPIASIMGYAETLLDDPALAPELVPLAEALHRNGRRLRDLFEDLLQLSRIEARRGELPLTRQPLLPLLERAVAPAADRAAQRDQEVSLECGDDVVADVNAEALTTIVSNLATNASAYTPDGGRIEVDVVRGHREVVVRVRDTGIGIDPAQHERIFERFYRVDEGRSRAAGGTGLGLAIVKHLARASGCRIEVQSALGQGSVFSVHVPAPGGHRG